MRYPYMICPARDLGTNVFSQVTCRPNPVFVWRDFEFTGVAKHVLQTIVRAILSSRFFWIMAHFFFSMLARPPPAFHPLRPLPNPLSRYGYLCVFGRSLWRLLCFRFQASFQHQGLWSLYPWTRWYD